MAARAMVEVRLAFAEPISAAETIARYTGHPQQQDVRGPGV